MVEPGMQCLGTSALRRAEFELASVPARDVVAPSQLNPCLDAELDAVILAAIAPDSEQRPASVRVLYARAAQVTLDPDLPPDLASLFGQPATQIWASGAGPSDTVLGVTLVLGQEAVLRTDSEPRLLVG